MSRNSFSISYLLKMLLLGIISLFFSSACNEIDKDRIIESQKLGQWKDCLEAFSGVSITKIDSDSVLKENCLKCKLLYEKEVLLTHLSSQESCKSLIVTNSKNKVDYKTINYYSGGRREKGQKLGFVSRSADFNKDFNRLVYEYMTFLSNNEDSEEWDFMFSELEALVLSVYSYLGNCNILRFDNTICNSSIQERYAIKSSAKYFTSFIETFWMFTKIQQNLKKVVIRSSNYRAPFELQKHSKAFDHQELLTQKIIKAKKEKQYEQFYQQLFQNSIKIRSVIDSRIRSLPDSLIDKKRFPLFYDLLSTNLDSKADKYFIQTYYFKCEREGFCKEIKHEILSCGIISELQKYKEIADKFTFNSFNECRYIVYIKDYEKRKVGTKVYQHEISGLSTKVSRYKIEIPVWIWDRKTNLVHRKVIYGKTPSWPDSLNFKSGSKPMALGQNPSLTHFINSLKKIIK